jgi:tripartite-type tricarboxylate transporter receptor subunit TctC
MHARLLLAGLLAMLNTCALAQNYPTRPLRMVVPWPPGGSNDMAARLLAPALAKSLGQQVIVDNRIGASGIIGSEVVAKSPPDGYTIMLNSATHVTNATTYRKLPYDTLNDFVALSPVAQMPTIMVVHPSLPVTSVRDLIALARRNPGRVMYSSGGPGGQTHLPALLFAKMAALDLVHVPYKGGGPAIVALLSGEVQLMCASMPSVIAHVRNRKLHALAVTSARRLRLLPDLPTVAEASLPGYEITLWLGLFGPAALPGALVERLHEEIQRALKLHEVESSFSSNGMETVAGTQAEFATFVRAELNKYAVLIRESGAADN